MQNIRGENVIFIEVTFAITELSTVIFWHSIGFKKAAHQ